MIHVNKHTELEWEEGMTVSDLLERLNYTFPHIIVRINGDLVPRGTYDERTVPDGADVRVVHLIAGG